MRNINWKHGLLASSLLLLGACASIPANLQGNYAEITPAQGSEPHWQGTDVRWGGVVVGSRLTDAGECAEIAQFQLDRFTYQPYRVFPGGDDGLHRGLLAKVSVGQIESAPRFLACADRFMIPDISRLGAVVTVVGTLQPALVFEVRGENCINTHRIEAIDAPDYSGTMHAAEENACLISLPAIKVTASREWREGPSQHFVSLR